jgi:hypothetical protein
MSPLRRIEDHRAGPSALGILVPPGRRTFLILRPRSLCWDLLVLRAGAASVFREMPQKEANALALALYQALGDSSGKVEASVEEVAAPEGAGFQVRVRAGPFALRVCERLPGQPYRPLLFSDRVAAQAAAKQLLGILCPPDGIEQEVYLNTRHFTS